MENGYTDSISIQRRTPQGDRSSPYIFILCIEILLIKLRLMDGKGINDSGLYDGLVDENMIQKNDRTGEAYADDLTIIFRMSGEAVQKILLMLTSFEMCSGLGINIGKTQLMVVGTDQ
jgi:hypothetical protein